MTNEMNESAAIVSTDQILEIPIGEIYMDHNFNCRGTLRPTDCEDLVVDISENGQLQAGIVTAYNVPHMPNKRWKLIAGHRRFYACKIAKVPFFKAVNDPSCQDERRARLINLSENLKRKDLTIMQEARAIEALIKLMPRDQVGKAVGKSGGWVQMRHMVLKFPDVVQQDIEAGMIKQTEIRDLYSIHKNQTEEELFAAVRKVKDARINGTGRVYLNPKKKKSRAAKQRNKGEILRMMETLRTRLGNGLHTRVLAWAIGEIPDQALAADIKRFVDDSVDPDLIEKYARSIRMYGEDAFLQKADENVVPEESTDE